MLMNTEKLKVQQGRMYQYIFVILTINKNTITPR